ncbi:aminotransferase [Lujinxingia litoralis]|uniref:Aminotransferase n=1 Tax=Lujinxingia litoralis TaxID=2211119 RepID=A0A328C6I0_9DELT|nr:pyridoxal phosphate-dependent aminotransferase [Lujinxingia litoralis]RAL22168.1 aminotransferase [Lujinxingia litoralis]
MSKTTQDVRSERIGFLEQSEIRAMTRECTRLGGINLGQGVCPLPSPPALLEAAAQAVREDLSTYSRFDGVDEVRQAVAEKLAHYNNLQVDPETEIVTTIGSAGAFVCTLQGLFNPGDEIIVFEPFYGYHVNAIRVAGCVPKVVTMQAPDWTFDPEDLERLRSDRTRAILVNTPGNPSGKVFGREELTLIADFCKAHDLLAITDEIYEYLVYDGQEHISLATLPGMFERTITMSGFSKTFAITGWRLGYVAAPAHLAEPIGLVNDLFYICAPTPLQHGLARALKVIGDDYFDEIRTKYKANRDLFCEALTRAGLTPHVPEGSYYILTDVSRFGLHDARASAMHILEKAGVASVAGSAFFASDGGRDLVRFCVAQPREVVEEAAERMQVFR